MASRGPIFIGGAGRSGTTLCVDMLGIHPEVSPVYETGFVSQIAGLIFGRRDIPTKKVQIAILQLMDRWSQGLPHLPHFKRAHERYHHGPHYVRFDRSFAMARTVELVDALEAGDRSGGFHRFVHALFAEHARLDGKPRWANKTPSYVHLLPVLGSLFPRMRFIHCVRDGRAVASSVVTRAWGPDNIAEAARWWERKARLGMEWGRKNPERYFELRYEAILTDPEATMSELLGFLGEEDRSAEMLATYCKNLKLDPRRAYTWQETFTDADRAAFMREAGGLLRELGYDQPAPELAIAG